MLRSFLHIGGMYHGQYLCFPNDDGLQWPPAYKGYSMLIVPSKHGQEALYFSEEFLDKYLSFR